MSRNKVKLNGKAADATASSLLVKARFAPPAATLASIKLNAGVARLVVGKEAIAVKTGPVADFPKIETVIGPVVTPKGATVVILFDVALITRAGIPLNWTATFCKRESKFCPPITTKVASGPLNGVTLVISGVNASYVNAPGAEPHVPSEFTTTTFIAPGEFCGALTRIVPESTTLTPDAGKPPK